MLSPLVFCQEMARWKQAQEPAKKMEAFPPPLSLATDGEARLTPGGSGRSCDSRAATKWSFC